ncbi:putative cytochrome c1 heme lyase [Grifola frondosa]|uniref:Holocytochrome c-type synthase n=1 Tax=Grifola frondosa TaxID=5627 RepID=A0A1C7MGX9_GRIFR|nr:putative cytochrome c1 heme lyase [Grifola frondosa]
MSSPDKCPVDHASLSHPSSSDKCPVDHSARSSWSSILARQSTNTPSSPQDASSAKLPLDREISSIPKTDGSKWVYPSQAQFFSAMARKNHNPQESDMKVIVPIHNAVNERAWMEVMRWEGGQGGDKCGGVKLVSFKGRPNDRTLRARWNTLLGYSPPFDRHDWVVDRCGTRMRYIIDFYTGHSSAPSPSNVSFYLDVRPAFDNWDAVRMRAERFWDRWTGRLWNSSPRQENVQPRP